jgi:hypothetical protein
MCHGIGIVRETVVNRGRQLSGGPAEEWREAWLALGCCRHSLSGFCRFSDHINHDLRLG